MIERERLKKLIQRFERKAETAYRNFQESGETRYDTTRRSSEEMADALRMALSAKEDHDLAIALKAELAILASRVQTASRMDGEEREERVDVIFQEILAMARLHKLCREEDA